MLRELGKGENVQCPRCLNWYSVSCLKALAGKPIENIEDPGRPYQPIDYYCPSDDKAIVVYDPGDGRLILANCILAEPNQEVSA